LDYVLLRSFLWSPPGGGQTYGNDEQIENISEQDSTETVTAVAGISKEIFEMTSTIIDCDLSKQVTLYEEKEAIEKEQLKYDNYWVCATRLNIRQEPNSDADIIDRLCFNEKISAAIMDNGWAKIENIDGYVKADYLNDSELSYTDYDAPMTSGFKSYMPYNVFSSKSNQYKLQQKCGTGQYGIRQYNGRYCVALGSHFNAIVGQYFDLILENGTVIPCIMADQKADCHTDSSNIITVANGCMTEFIVDLSSLNSKAKQMGDISYCEDDWNSRVVTVRVYEEKVDLR
jgi:hypothetical protein